MPWPLPGVAGDAPWMDTIDADNVWRQDSATVTTSLFRVNYDNNPSNPAVYEETGLASGEYKVYVTWAANVTQDVPDQENAGYPICTSRALFERIEGVLNLAGETE